MPGEHWNLLKYRLKHPEMRLLEIKVYFHQDSSSFGEQKAKDSSCQFEKHKLLHNTNREFHRNCVV